MRHDEARKRVYSRRKVCRFCADRNLTIDYKDSRFLRSFITERGKIAPGASPATAPGINDRSQQP